MAADDFKLEPGFVPAPGRHGGARPGAGRPPGSRNHRSEINWRIVDETWPRTLQGIAAMALRITDPLFPTMPRHQQRMILDCALWIGERQFPEPRSAPVQIGITQLNREAVIEAVEAGELTPADAATLIRVGQLPGFTAGTNGEQSARETLLERLSRIRADRAGEPLPVPPASESEPPPPAAMTEDELMARVLAAVERKLEEEP